MHDKMLNLNVLDLKKKQTNKRNDLEKRNMVISSACPDCWHDISLQESIRMRQPSVVQVPSRHLTQGLADSCGSHHNTSIPSEPTSEHAQSASLQPKDPRGLPNFQPLRLVSHHLIKRKVVSRSIAVVV